MRQPKCHEGDHIQFLIASPRVISCCEASRGDPRQHRPAAHDAYNRLIHRLEPDPETLFQEVEPLVDKRPGVLVIDDSKLDKPYSRKIEPVSYHWSGKHHAVVKAINLISMVWTDGDLMMPTDYRVYDKASDGKTNNGHFQNMLDAAKKPDFAPEAVLFDIWHSSLANLKRVRDHGWIFLTRLKVNRKGIRIGQVIGQSVRRQSRRRAASLIWRVSGRSRSSGSSPKTVTLSIGQPMTSGWTNFDGCNWRSKAGPWRTLTGFSSSRATSNAGGCEPQDRGKTTSVWRFEPWRG